MIQALAVVGALLVGQTLHSKPPSIDPTPETREPEPATVEYDVLRPDPAWCAPRILYFFACYHGMDRSLEEIITLCRTDAAGYTSVLDLVEAARALDLEPTPIVCATDQLLDLEGPAILCTWGPKIVRKGNEDNSVPGEPGNADPVLHFVGLLGRDHDRYVIFNPGRFLSSFRVTRDGLKNEFTGHAILLRGCRRPWLRPGWMTITACLAGSAGLSLVALYTPTWIRRIRQRQRTTGITS